MDVNCYHELSDGSPETIGLVADLIEASRTDEHMVYREAELDEVWRWIGAGHTGSLTMPPELRDATLAEIVAIHDMLEDPGNARPAAERLRALIAIEPAHQP